MTLNRSFFPTLHIPCVFTGISQIEPKLLHIQRITGAEHACFLFLPICLQQPLWKRSAMLTVGIVVIKFKTYVVFRDFIISRGRLLNLEKVSVMNVVINIEGRQVPRYTPYQVPLVKSNLQPTEQVQNNPQGKCF